jgi:hypothetical protein
MALQGTIDAFPLVDVVQLLGASHKTGCLTVHADDGAGRIWVEDGALVAADHGGEPASDGVHALFRLLRPAHGSFVFDPAAEPEGPLLEAVPLLELLGDAAALLEEWAAIVAVLPTPQHRPVLVPEPGLDEVRLDADDWRLVAVAGSLTSAAELGEVLGVDEVTLGRRLVRLVGEGLVRIEDPVEAQLVPDPSRSEVADPAAHPDGGIPRAEVPPVEGGDEAAEVLDPLSLVAPPAEPQPFPDRFPIDDLVAEGGEAEDPWAVLDDDRFAAAQPFTDHDAPVVLEAVGDAGWADATAFADPSAAEPGDAFAPAAFSGDGFTPASFGDDAFAADAFTGSAFATEDLGLDASGLDVPAMGADGLHVGAFDGLEDRAFASAPAFAADHADVQPEVPSDVPSVDGVVGDDGPDSTDEILRQMSRLSPKAAEAIAAALGTASDAGEDLGAPPA